MTGPYLSLATFRRNGTEVPTPVWFAEAGGKLYVFTDGTSAKMKRLRNNSRVRIARCDVVGNVTGEWIDGTCRIVSEPPTIKTAYAALRAKYGWQMWAVDALSWLGGRIGRRAMLEIQTDRPSS